jgi:hypothetical protein
MIANINHANQKYINLFMEVDGIHHPFFKNHFQYLFNQYLLIW